MVDNFEYGNFENLTSTLRHLNSLCVGNLDPHFQHIVTVVISYKAEGVWVWVVMMLGDAMTPFKLCQIVGNLFEVFNFSSPLHIRNNPPLSEQLNVIAG